MKIYTIIKPEFNVIDVENSPELSKMLNRYFNDACTVRQDIVIDMGNIMDISSSGIGLFISLNSKLHKMYHSLSFINLNEHVIKVFDITKLNSFFKIYKDYNELMNG